MRFAKVPSYYRRMIHAIECAETVRDVVEIENAIKDANVAFCKVGDDKNARICGKLLDITRAKKLVFLDRRKGGEWNVR